MSATVANLAHPKLTGGGVAKPTFSSRLVYLQFVQMPAPPSPELRAPCPVCYLSFSILCLLFSFFLFLFLLCGAEVSLTRGLCWFMLGVAVGIPCATYLLTCWSVSPKQVRRWHLVAWEPSWFLHIMWYGEALCRLGVRECWNFASSWWFFLPGVSPMSQQDFSFMELTLSTFSL
jgi:hypothetical protein